MARLATISEADEESFLRTRACFTNHLAQKTTRLYYNTMSARFVAAVQESGLAKVKLIDTDPKGDDPTPEKHLRAYRSK